MGLFGALFAGVSGLSSQSNKIGIISNNISNVNTVGFKQGQAAFNTLVVPSGSTSFSPGGVIGTNQQLVNQQGLIQATSSSTDAAITGNGFFAVNTEADGTGSLLLTRAGSFTQDSNGNFVNANGFFLQGIPTSPPTSINTNNLKTVTVNQSASGTATSTSAITLAANFNANQAILLGNGATASMQSSNGTTAGVNVGNNAKGLIVGNDIPGTAPTNNLVRGNTVLIQSVGGTTTNVTDTFTYGGFTIGRDVTSTIDGTILTGNGKDGGGTLDGESLAGTTITNDGLNDKHIAVTVTNPGDYTIGQHITISGVTGNINGIPASEINGEHIVTGTNSGAGPITFDVATTNGTGGSAGHSATAITVSNRTLNFTGNILNATTQAGDFLASGATPLTTSNFAADALHFTIAVGGGTPATFSYSTTPDPTSGTFNNLNNLASAINDSPGLTARVVDGRLYVGPTDTTQSVTFGNGDAVGTGPGAPGIDWVQELGLPATLAAPPSTTHLFNSLASLADQINLVDPTNLTAVINNPNASSTLDINEANPEQTINFTNGQTGGTVLRELGFANITPTAGTYSTGTLNIKYSPASSQTDMSSGAVTPQFSHDITIFDAQGNSHTLALNVVKLGTNLWGVELTAVPANSVTTTTGDGQIASGQVSFNGDGTFNQVIGSIGTSNIPIPWTNGASPSTIKVNLGTSGKGDGLTQSAAAFNVSLAQQNGSPIGQLTGVTIDAGGFVIETFSNGQTEKVFQIPLAAVSNPDGLLSVSGDAFQQTLASGQVNLNEAGQGGTGTIAPSALEQSNVDLSTQLTNMIVAQQAYGANSKVLTVTDQLLQQLDQIIQ